jgi:cellulose synthase/poly-beta-1,6-N-acetylglucosamine synthase-like glycosyltransferase
MDAVSFLLSLDMTSLVLLFWYTTLFEIPRYTIGALVVPAVMLWSQRRSPTDTDLTLSVVLVGHNEEKPLPACVESLTEQTIHSQGVPVQIVVVDDGSTDRMNQVANCLQHEGKIDRVLRLGQRGGKSAGVNLAISVCSGDIIVISDIDTTFDRNALAELISYFSDSRVGAVSGNLGVRNTSASLMTRFQAIEYAIGLSLGRCIADALGTLSVVSGAFGAFRRSALESVGRQDVEVGEDADLTMKLRRAGWRLRFAPEARALTDVPETVSAFIAQRLRWDRGLITIWSRKFRGAMDPRPSTFRLVDAAAVFDVIFFQVLLAIAFPVYVIWLAYYFGGFAVTIIGATLVGYSLLDGLAFLAAATIGIRTPPWLVLYLPLYTLLQITLVRTVRLIAIVQELIFHSSYRDPYVPRRVMSQVEVV